MTIAEMSLGVRMRLNALDASRYRRFKQPHIDWALNEAEEVFKQAVIDPRRRDIGVEVTQRNLDDLREITVNQKPAEAIQLEVFDESSYAGALPDDYRHFLRGYVNAKKGECTKRVRAFLAQLDDEFEADPFTKSSFEWEEVNFHPLQGSLFRVYTDGTFVAQSMIMDYLRKTKYMHNAAAYTGGEYLTPDGVTLSGSQDCELAHHTHSDIVEIAVAILTNSLRIGDYQMKIAQLDKFFNV